LDSLDGSPKYARDPLDLCVCEELPASFFPFSVGDHGVSSLLVSIQNVTKEGDHQEEPR